MESIEYMLAYIALCHSSSKKYISIRRGREELNGKQA